MIQTWTDWPHIYPAIVSDGLLSPAKPVVLGEPAYEDGPEYPMGPITPLVVRRQAWWTFMAGGYFTYGQNALWRMEPDWTSYLDRPGTAQMTVLRAVATSRPWWKRVPDQGMFASGVGCERTLNTAVRSVEGDWAMVYLSDQCHVLLNLDKLLTQHVRATWVNPADGEQRDAGVFLTGNRSDRVFPKAEQQWFRTPDHWEDAVLLLDGEA